MTSGGGRRRRRRGRRRRRRKREREKEEKEKGRAPTPAQAQKALSDEPGANLPRHRHVGLPGLGEDPAEGRQEEKVQKGRGHDADALRTKRERGKRESGREKKKIQSPLFKQPQRNKAKTVLVLAPTGYTSQGFLQSFLQTRNRSY